MPVIMWLETVSVILGQIQLNIIIEYPTKQVSTEHGTSADEEQKVQGLLLKILTAGLQESRYAVFEHTIKAYEEDCYERAYSTIAESNQHDKDDQLKRLTDLYEKHVKDYPKQNRQAILDGQIAEPISRNAGVAVNALCHQMFGFAL